MRQHLKDDMKATTKSGVFARLDRLHELAPPSSPSPTRTATDVCMITHCTLNDTAHYQHAIVSLNTLEHMLVLLPACTIVDKAMQQGRALEKAISFICGETITRSSQTIDDGREEAQTLLRRNLGRRTLRELGGEIPVGGDDKTRIDNSRWGVQELVQVVR